MGNGRALAPADTVYTQIPESPRSPAARAIRVQMRHHKRQDFRKVFEARASSVGAQNVCIDASLCLSQQAGEWRSTSGKAPSTSIAQTTQHFCRLYILTKAS